MKRLVTSEESALANIMPKAHRHFAYSIYNNFNCCLGTLDPYFLYEGNLVLNFNKRYGESIGEVIFMTRIENGNSETSFIPSILKHL